MILSRHTILSLIYSDPYQYRLMRLRLSNYDDFQFIDYMKSYFINIQLISKGIYSILTATIMKLSEAKKIVGKMVQWTMLSQGITLNVTPDQITEDLATLLKANHMVVKARERSKKRIDKIVAEKGRWSGKRSIPMTIADRGIAALYVAANFQGDQPGNADCLAMHNNSVVFCLDKHSLNDELNDE